MAYTKHTYNGEDLLEIERAFQKIARKHPFKNNFKNYNPQEELIAVNTLSRLVNIMYEKNDFRASSYAYIYTVPKILEIIDYCHKSLENKRVLDWCNATNEFCFAIELNGSKKQYSNLGFLYECLHKQQQAKSARYFIKDNIQYLEQEKSEKDYPPRARVLEGAIWWFNQALLGRFGLKMPFCEKNFDFVPKEVVFATFPNSGKSYLNNVMNAMFAELSMIIYQSGGFLRVSNEQGNILRQSRQTQSMIENKLIFDIYPENKEFIVRGKYNPFKMNTKEEWILNNVKFDPDATVCKTRDSAINSVRCRIASMDDPSRGQQEANNVKIHNEICQLYYGDFTDRFKNQNDRCLLLTGTMFNPNGIIATRIQGTMKGATQDYRFRNVYISKDKETVIIVNDCENHDGTSAYPELISTKSLEEKRQTLDPYSYACTWRQRPIPADGLIFDYQNLKTYDILPLVDLSNFSKAYIDPTRRSARDFFAMPVFRQHKESLDYYLCDTIYQQKSSKDLYGKIVDTIIKNKIVLLIIEENVDGSLASIIKDRLKALGITWCEIKTIYNTVNKSQRIADMAGSVKTSVVFPEQYSVSPKSELGNMVRMFTQFTTIGRNLFDDAPDAICGFVEHAVIKSGLGNKIRFRKKLPF